MKSDKKKEKNTSKKRKDRKTSSTNSAETMKDTLNQIKKIKMEIAKETERWFKITKSNPELVEDFSDVNAEMLEIRFDASFFYRVIYHRQYIALRTEEITKLMDQEDKLTPDSLAAIAERINSNHWKLHVNIFERETKLLVNFIGFAREMKWIIDPTFPYDFLFPLFAFLLEEGESSDNGKLLKGIIPKTQADNFYKHAEELRKMKYSLFTIENSRQIVQNFVENVCETLDFTLNPVECKYMTEKYKQSPRIDPFASWDDV